VITYEVSIPQNSAIQWVQQTNNAKLLEALCERGLQINETARERLRPRQPLSTHYSGRPMANPPPPPTTGSICEAAIERGQAKFQATVKKICEASIESAKLPRVLAFIVAEYAVCEIMHHYTLRSRLM
jgi:hypothetical protein